MKKHLFIYMAIIFLVINMIASNSHAKSNSWNKILPTGILRIGFDSSYYPMTFYNQQNNQPVGIDVDLANLVAKKLDLKIKWIAQKRKNLIQGLINKRYDMIWSGFSITANRQKQVLFSQPYYSNSKRILVKFETGKKRKNICGLKVGVQSGTTSQDVGKTIPCGSHKQITFLKYPNNQQAFQDLNKNNIQAIILDTSYGLYYSAQHIRKYRMFSQPLNKKEDKAIAFRLQDSHLKNIIDMAIKNIIQDHDFSNISQKWTHNNIIY